MAKISTYDNASPVALSDKIIGTSVGATPANATKNFLISDLLTLFESEITLQDVLNAGNTATQDIILTGNITQSGGALSLGGTVRDFNGNLGAVGETLVADASGQLVFASGTIGSTIYTADGTVGTTRVLTLTDSLTFTSGQMIRTANSTNIVEVTDSTHLPSTLAANTTYVIRGLITTANTINVTNDGSKIIGLDRTKDIIQYTGTGTFCRVIDVDFTMQNIGINTTSTGKILDADNYTAGVSANNYGRTKVLQIFGCEFRGCYNIMTVTGFELVDLNNTLCWYTTGTIGFQFKDVRHLEISSCEMYNWYDEATATTYSTASMIELLANGADNVGFAVVNINSSIVHPEQTQNGLDINSASTTSFGTIASNTFIDAGLTTGELFLPVVSGLPDYSQTYTNTFDVMTNQGLLNSTSGVVMTMLDNRNITTLTANTPAIVTVGTPGSGVGEPTLQAGVRYTVSSAGRATYTGTKQVFVSMHASVSYEKQGSGTDPYSFYFYKNGSQLAGSETQVEANAIGSINLVYGVLMTPNDYIELYVENTNSNDDMIVLDFQVVIRE